MAEINLGGIVDASTIDCCGKGACSVIYLCGCPFRCPFCHNPDLVNRGEICRKKEVKDIVEILKQNYLVQSVTLTGGEPLMQEAILDLVKEIKANTSLKVKIDTNGFYPEKLSEILPLIDAVSMDLKATLDQGYGKASGLEGNWETVVEKVRKTLGILREWNGIKEARTTVVPGIVDTEESINEISLAAADAKFNRYILQQFRNDKTLDPSYREKQSPSYELMHSLGLEAKKNLPDCRVYIVTALKGMQEIKI